MRNVRHLGGDFLTKLGVFSSMLFVTATAVYIYSPVIGSHADESTTSKVNATVNPVASVTLDTSDISFTFTPTASGVFESKLVNATVNTNSTGGYELYFSSEDNETNMVNPLVSDVIASDFTGTVTSETIAANNWGYSLNNTDFSKIPALNAQATLKNIDHYPTTAEKTTTVNIGMKVDTNLPSGTYSKNVVFSVVAHETPEPTISSITRMQDITTEICNASSVNESNMLIDTRDNNTYTVKKLLDGKCWMTQSLKISGKTITGSDSDITEGTTWTIGSSSLSGFDKENQNDVYINSTYGGYYSFYAATAGSIVSTEGNVQKSICPKGWRLPTGGWTNGEFEELYNKYNSKDLMMGDPGFVMAGAVVNGAIQYRDQHAYYWSSTASDSDAFNLDIRSSGVYPSDASPKHYGYLIHCVAR